MAAAHLGLQHILIDSLAISSAGLSGEGWKVNEFLLSLLHFVFFCGC
jgi:hypothetical protein